MSESNTSEHFLVLRLDFDDPETLAEHHVVFHTLEDSDKGQAIQTFPVDVDNYEQLPDIDTKVRQYRLVGILATGEKVVCTVIYDDNSFTQRLRIESEPEEATQ